MARVDYSPISVDVNFSQSQPRHCVSVTILPDAILEDYENFTVTIAEIGQYENGLDIFLNSSVIIIEGTCHQILV